tara:strand:+ start:222 stop:581 length:360 start_codon:yes stop_codon:yes gene_type:complete
LAPPHDAAAGSGGTTVASSLSQLTGGGTSAAPGGAGAISLDGAMGQVYTGEVGLILCGIAVVFFLYVAAGGRGAGGGVPRSDVRPRSGPEIRRGRGRVDVSALRRARMASPDPEVDPYS